jgi:hypothetical protein
MTENIRLQPGSVILAPHEVAMLRVHIARWEQAPGTPGGDSSTPLVDLGCEIRGLLNSSEVL